MKKQIFYMLFGCLSLSGIIGCDNAENQAFDNAIYLVEAENRDSYDCISTRMGDRQFNVSLRMTSPQDYPVKVTLALDEQVLADHNVKFDEALQLLPTENWAFVDSDGNLVDGRSMEATIPAGQNTVVFPVRLKNVAKDDMTQYALPLSIVNVSMNMPVLEKQKTVLYTFQKDFEVPVLFLKPYARIMPKFDDFPSTNSWAIEFHFTFDRTTKDNLYGQVLTFFGNTGGEGLYVRPYKDNDNMDIHLFGIFGVASFSVANELLWSDSKFQGRWHHFAFVCDNGVCYSYLDGKLMASNTNPQWQTPVQWTGMNFSDQNHTAWIGYSEYRIWSVARSLEDLNRNKYLVNPNSKGLYAYYKLDDKNDNLIKDYTQKGHDIDVSQKEDGDNQFVWGTAKNDEDLRSLQTVLDWTN